MAITKHYAYAGERRIHYRRAGSGPPLVMMHASPGSSLMLEPLIPHLAQGHTVIALDTPGYGESAGIGIAEPTMADYAAALNETLDALGLTTIDLYGSHTGGKVTLEFVLRHPERVRRFILDGIGLYTPEEQANQIANYTPSLAPQFDGSHLIRAWAMRRDMMIFWPWFNRTPEGRMTRDMPSPETLHVMMVDFLRSIPDYWMGYQAAFRYEGADALRRLTVPTLFIASPTDPLSGHLTRTGELPAVVTIDAPPTGSDHQAALAARIREYLAGDSLPDCDPAQRPVPMPGIVRRDYIDSRVGQLVMRRSGDWSRVGSSIRPIVLFQASPGSSLGLEPLLLAFGHDRPAVTFDTPGNGDSPPVPGAPSIADLAAALLDGIDGLGLTEYDLYGTHTGAMIALDIAISRPDQVRHVIADGVTIYDEAETRRLVENYPYVMKPTSDGGYLLTAWYFLRDMVLWWPWFNRTSAGARDAGLPTAEALHRNFVEFMKGGLTYHHNYVAAFSYPTAARLPLVGCPVLHTANEGDPLRDCVAPAVELTPTAQSLIHTGASRPETVAAFRAFLGKSEE